MRYRVWQEKMRYRVFEEWQENELVPAGLACEQGGQRFRCFRGRILDLATPLDDVSPLDFPGGRGGRIGPEREGEDFPEDRFLRGMMELLIAEQRRVL